MQRALAINLMNEGHALATEAAGSSLLAAIRAYSQAIAILELLPPNPDNLNSLAAALLNRGQLLHQARGHEAHQEALADLQRASSLLEPLLDDDAPWFRRNLVGALVNQANLRLDLRQPQTALELARRALDLQPLPPPSSDPADLHLALLAARAFCDAAGHTLPQLDPNIQDALAQEAANLARAALQRIRLARSNHLGEPFAEISERLFRFASNLAAIHQPESLPELCLEHLSDLRSPYVRRAVTDAAREAIRLAVEEISRRARRPEGENDSLDHYRALAEQLLQLDTYLFHPNIGNHGPTADHPSNR